MPNVIFVLRDQAGFIAIVRASVERDAFLTTAYDSATSSVSSLALCGVMSRIGSDPMFLKGTVLLIALMVFLDFDVPPGELNADD